MFAGTLANAGDTFQPASRIAFAPSSPPNRIMRAGFETSRSIIRSPISVSGGCSKDRCLDQGGDEGRDPGNPWRPGAKSSLVALNALHFKSRWKSPFDPALTAAVFVGVDGKGREVAMTRLGRGIRGSAGAQGRAQLRRHRSAVCGHAFLARGG
jgi:hypothetical protein